MLRPNYPASYDRHRPYRYWRQDIPREKQNFGDYLTELLLDRLFVNPVFPADAYHLLGSVISQHWIEHSLWSVEADAGLVAFWLCGLRDAQGLAPEAKDRARFFGVRGPLTRDALGLAQDTVLGDPGLLVPIIYPVRRPSVARGSLCIPHFNDPISDEAALATTGAESVARPAIRGGEKSLLKMIRTIAQSGFVLSGALHGAILACAYNVPFAFLDTGFVDIPFKWQDFAAAVGITCEFVRTVEEGQRWYQDVFVSNYRPLPLAPMLAVSPLAVRHGAIVAALCRDGLLSPRARNRVISALKHSPVDNQGFIESNQAAFIESRRK
jgi:hypothetical protein